MVYRLLECRYKHRGRAGDLEVRVSFDRPLVRADPFRSLEIVDYRSRALILYDSGARTWLPLRVSGCGGRRLRQEVATTDLKDYTHRPQLERSRTIRETYAAIVAGLQAHGLPEGEAMLRANDEMEKQGYFPRTPRLTAVKIESFRQDVRVFEISKDEFRFGLFPDIEEAIAQPGTGVHFEGRYITHQDFDTSRKLNTYLAEGNKSFIVKTDKGMFLLNVTCGTGKSPQGETCK
jgi:hypothetical protein